MKRSSHVSLTPNELLKLLRISRNTSTRDWAMVLLSYRHGLRASEVCGLKLEDLDLKNDQVSIRRLKNSLPTVQPIYTQPGQPLLDERKALREWLRKRPSDGSPFAFNSQKGGALGRIAWFRRFKNLATEAGLPPEKRHPHVLKHSLASHLVGENVNLSLIRQALGHRSIQSTMVYAGGTDQQAAEAVRRASMTIF